MGLVLRVVLLWLLFIGELQAGITSSYRGPASGIGDMSYKPQAPGYPPQPQPQVNAFQPRSDYKPMPQQPMSEPQPRSMPVRPIPDRPWSMPVPPPQPRARLERPVPPPPSWPMPKPWPFPWCWPWRMTWRCRPLPVPGPVLPIPDRPWPMPEPPQPRSRLQPRSQPQQLVPGYRPRGNFGSRLPGKTEAAPSTEGLTGMSGTRLTSGSKRRFGYN